MAARTQSTNDLLRALPSIDSLLRTATGVSLRTAVGDEHLTILGRRVIDELRQEALTNAADPTVFRPAGQDDSRTALLEEAERRLLNLHQTETLSGLRRVINATGVILHTNLGRAPLSAAARRAMAEEAAGYCTLEYDLTTGARGRRGARAEDLLANVTGAEAALIVNNCAAATLLVLIVLAHDGEAIISRGELVEIGGDFRVPEVMAQSGTRMVEVGTTNRTRISDYRKAISEDTRLIMRVHTSNYRIVGFTETPALRELAELAHTSGLLLCEDAGSGALVDFAEFGVTGEPLIRASLDDGADIVSFSGDKLLGGPQVGLIVGRRDLISRMRSHPLYRSLRADKLRIAALEATLDSYARHAAAIEIPAHRFIAAAAKEIAARARKLIGRMSQDGMSEAIQLETIEGSSAVGGGAAPTSQLPTVLISLTHARLSCDQIEAALRNSSPPVIARIEDDRVLLDLRTVDESEESSLVQSILSLPH